IYNLAFYCNQDIRDQYHQRHPNSENNLVRMNDVVFSVHGFIISTLILLQTCVYKVSIWLDFMYYLSSVKLIVSFIKYLPQLWLNYKRQSTQGWSITFIFWDLSGGLLSIVQLLLDAYIDGDWSGIEGVGWVHVITKL
ncbi:PQ loop repeat-domain-containing protein, partial [Parasitella parasitica]